MSSFTFATQQTLSHSSYLEHRNYCKQTEKFKNFFSLSSAQVLGRLNFHPIVKMAPPYKTDADFEHRVFVKDVPADLATTIIGFLSQHYNPVKVENLFPRGATTTLAVSFLTFEEASQVQLETDAARMENSILRAEMDRHPRRPMRVPRSRMHATRRANDNIHEEEVKDIKKRPAEPGYVSPLGKAQPDTSAASTWAQVVSKDNKIGMSLPPPSVAVRMRDTTTAYPT
jgi:hypothetical protein